MSLPIVAIVGRPNVGKSTFINSFAGAARAKAANKPGVTRGKQWITVDDYDLMDMPGVLWKKFDSLETATNLAFIGSIKDDILDIEELACGLLSGVRAIYPQRLMERYKLDEQALALPPYDLLQAIGAKRGMLISGGEDGGTPVAIGFRAKKSNGKYKYYWLYRVKFGIPATNLATKGDSITFSTPTIEGTILRRNKVDGNGKHPWKAEVTEGDSAVTADTITNWYKEVYEPSYTTAAAE